MKLSRLLCLIVCTASFALAQEEPKDKAPDKKPAPATTPKEDKDPALSVTEHEVTIGGKTIKYRATAGYLVLKTEKGDPRANLFFVAYTKLGELLVQRRPRLLVGLAAPRRPRPEARRDDRQG
jgi:carboxypeptidase C (cathepsin A)